MSRGYRQIDHTADIALELWADSENELLIVGARAVTDILTDGAEVSEGAGREIAIDAVDRADRLVQWLNEVIVVPATRTIRGLTTEVVLTPDDGMPTACALNFDHVALAQRERLGSVLCDLPSTRWPEARRALLIACGFERPETVEPTT